MFSGKKNLVIATIVTLLPGFSPLAAQSVPVVSQLVPPMVFTPPSTPRTAPVQVLPAPAPHHVDATDEAAIEARILLHLAAADEEDGKISNAINLYKQVIAISETTMKPSMDSAIASGRLGALYADLKRLPAAMKYAKQALNAFQKLEGPVCNDVGIELNNIAWIQEQLGDKLSAEKSYQKTISVLRASADENGDLIAVAYNNLGDLYTGQHRYKEAMTQYKTAQQFARDFFGDDHPLARLIAGKVQGTKRLLKK